MAAPNLREIEWAISELEGEESSKSNYILLAALYTCRNGLQGMAAPQAVAAYAEDVPDHAPLGEYGDSEFLQAVAGKDSAAAWGIMDELMDTLRVVNQRAYESVIRKLARL